MGIYDREYIRGGPRSSSGFGAVRMWSVNTWIIVINVAVFVGSMPEQAAVDADPAWPEPMNNLGVVLMERGKTAEAVQVFQRAYALDNGESDAIRDNLRLALAKTEKSVITEVNEDNYKLVRRGSGDYLIRPTP